MCNEGVYKNDGKNRKKSRRALIGYHVLGGRSAELMMIFATTPNVTAIVRNIRVFRSKCNR